MQQVAHRMSQAELTFVDPNGKPLGKKEVSVKLLSHEFLFGCGAFDALPCASNRKTVLRGFLPCSTVFLVPYPGKPAYPRFSVLLPSCARLCSMACFSTIRVEAPAYFGIDEAA